MAIVDKVVKPTDPADDMTAYNEYVEILDAIIYRVNNAYDTEDITYVKIENRAFLGEANKKIEARVPDYADLSAEKLDRLKDAVIYQAAIELLLAESKLKSEDTEGELVAGYDHLKIDDVIARYEDNINDIIAETTPKTNIAAGVFDVVNPKKRF